jgi:organic hydroperoxide reductase OsmC/OhrA
MSDHRATIRWQRQTESFAYQDYNRAHDWIFDAGVTVPASASPSYRGTPERVDPEEAFVASLSSCHLLTFLAIATKRGFVVDAYEDEAIGWLEKGPSPGKLWVARVELHPRVRFAPEKGPDREALEKLHHEAHEGCFIANSVRTEVTVVIE